MDISKSYLIEYYSDFKEMLSLIFTKIDNGTIIQFFKNNPSIYYDEIDINQLKGKTKYPDSFTCFFYNKKNNKNYKFEVELYHGFGGTWEEIED